MKSIIIVVSKVIRGLVILFFVTGYAIAQQSLPDGTFATAAFINEIKSNLPKENALKFDTSSVDLSVNLSLAIYIIRDNTGNLNINPSDILPALDVVNGYFKSIGMKFNVKTVTNVDDYNYSYFSIYNRPKELLVKHSVERTINLYLVDSISKDSVEYYGYTYFPVDTVNNYIFLQKRYFTGNYLSCMLGHFFGLLSTHEKMGGIEFVNESNCSSAGDFICDTYADPDILNMVNYKCLYFGIFRDPNFEYYVPSVANIMSDGPGKCRCIFTKQQYRRMYYYYKKYRQYLR
jgi:hypothetical protein